MAKQYQKNYQIVNRNTNLVVEELKYFTLSMAKWGCEVWNKSYCRQHNTVTGPYFVRVEKKS